MSRFLSPNETIQGIASGKDSYWDNVYAHNILSGNEGFFTQNISAYEFIGKGSGLTDVYGTDGTKLPLSGGVLTGQLDGTTGIFTTSLSAPNLSGSFYGDGSGLTNVTGIDGTKLPLSGGRVDGDLVINGSLTALSSATFVNTTFTTTSALSVLNYGIGPALYVFQTSGLYDIASFYDQDYGEVFHIGNDGKIGVKESSPNKELTVNGEISAKGDIWADKFRGDGSLLTNIVGTDGTKLPLSGGVLTDSLTGTVGLFTTSLSAPNLSGSFYGNGSGLTNIVGTDGTKLPLSGGTLTGGITGTTAIFNSLSVGSISGNFYGDVSNGTNAPHYYVTCRTAVNQSGEMNISVNPHTFTYFTTGALTAIDGVIPAVGDIILFGGQTTSTQSGPWKVVNAGSVGVSAVLERPVFFRGTVKFGTSFTISKGTSFQGSTYNLFSAPAGINDITVGSTNVFFGISFTRGANNATNSTNTFTGTQTLAVGTTTLAPLRFQAGTLLTTPVQNTVEWDGNFMYLTTSGANSARTTNVVFVSAPATGSSYGLAGQVAYDSSFFYVCTATNTWLKAPLTTSGVLTDGTKLPLSGGILTGSLTGTTGLFTTSLSAPNLSGTFYGDGSKLTGIITSVIDGTKLPLSGGVLTGPLTGTVGLFTTSLSAPNLSGSFYGNGSGLTNITGTDGTKLPLSGGTLTGSLTGTVGLFTTYLSSVSVSGTFYGDGSKLTGILGTDGTKLPLSGGTLTGSLTGTTGLFTTSLSAPNLSGTFYGNGSGLTNVTGTDGTKLPLSGGVLTDSLTGTTGLFTISLSAPNLSGTFYGDGSKLTGIAGGGGGTDGTKLPLSGGTLTGGITGTTATFTNSVSSPNISGTFYGDGGNLYNIQSQINFIFDGSGSTVALNSIGTVQIPYNIKIVSWTLLSNLSSTTEVQVLTSNYANHPTYTLISGTTNSPKLVNSTKAESSSMTDWVTAIPANYYLQFKVNSNDSATNLTIALKCLRSS